MVDLLDSFAEWYMSQFSVLRVLFVIRTFKSTAITTSQEMDTDSAYSHVSTVHRTITKVC